MRILKFYDEKVKTLTPKNPTLQMSNRFVATDSMCLKLSLVSITLVKTKIYPLQAMKAQGDVDARVNIHTVTALGRGRVPSPTLDCHYPQGKLSGPQDQSGHEGVKKNLHPSDTQHQTQAVQP